jgi:hypothetical protein
MKISNIFKTIIFVVLIGLFGFAITNVQEISDWFRLRNYEPPARVVKLADDTTMTDNTRRLFYVNHPDLGDKQEFNDHCRTTEQSIVLGCYINTQGIFLLDVEDKRLNGVIEVTAAHEVLHAAYERLSKSEKDRVDKLTSDFFSKLKNQRILETVENYRKKDPSIVPNELHSILGTEVRDLSPELEKYYSQYFINRKIVVDFSEQYEQTFTNLRNQVDAYDAQLNQLKNQIDSNQQQITAANDSLQTDRANLDRLLASGNTDEYNQRVPAYNQSVANYNGLVNETRQLITTFNNIVEKRNALATVEQELVQAIDSSNLTTEKAQ